MFMKDRSNTIGSRTKIQEILNMRISSNTVPLSRWLTRLKEGLGKAKDRSLEQVLEQVLELGEEEQIQEEDLSQEDRAQTFL